MQIRCLLSTFSSIDCFGQPGRVFGRPTAAFVRHCWAFASARFESDCKISCTYVWTFELHCTFFSLIAKNACTFILSSCIVVHVVWCTKIHRCTKEHKWALPAGAHPLRSLVELSQWAIAIAIVLYRRLALSSWLLTKTKHHKVTPLASIYQKLTK